MNKYELALVLTAKIEDDARAATLEKVKDLITRFGGSITNVDEWGKKRLAYEIQKMREGFYYFIQFDANADCPAELEKRVRITDNVIRYLIVRADAQRQEREIDNMNKVILMGRLTRDPEMRVSQGDNALNIAKFSLAVDRRFQRNGEKETDFFNCTAFGKQADFVDRYLKQGTKILLVGRIQNDNYTNKEGQKVYSVQIIAEEIEFAESKNAGSTGGGAPAGRPDPGAAAGDGFMNIPDGIDEELPFN